MIFVLAKEENHDRGRPTSPFGIFIIPFLHGLNIPPQWHCTQAFGIIWQVALDFYRAQISLHLKGIPLKACTRGWKSAQGSHWIEFTTLYNSRCLHWRTNAVRVECSRPIHPELKPYLIWFMMVMIWKRCGNWEPHVSNFREPVFGFQRFPINQMITRIAPRKRGVMISALFLAKNFWFGPTQNKMKKLSNHFLRSMAILILSRVFIGKAQYNKPNEKEKKIADAEEKRTAEAVSFICASLLLFCRFGMISHRQTPPVARFWKCMLFRTVFPKVTVRNCYLDRKKRLRREENGTL